MCKKICSYFITFFFFAFIAQGDNLSCFNKAAETKGKLNQMRVKCHKTIFSAVMMHSSKL